MSVLVETPQSEHWCVVFNCTLTMTMLHATTFTKHKCLIWKVKKKVQYVFEIVWELFERVSSSYENAKVEKSIKPLPLAEVQISFCTSITTDRSEQFFPFNLVIFSLLEPWTVQKSLPVVWHRAIILLSCVSKWVWHLWGLWLFDHLTRKSVGVKTLSLFLQFSSLVPLYYAADNYAVISVSLNA